MSSARDIGRRLRARLPGQQESRRALYWERRAPELIDTYDDPSSWPAKRWLREGVEERFVPRFLLAAGVRSVLVIGCGSGRQFDFLAPHGFELYGLDISPTMVETCRRRFPDIRVEVAGVVGADKLFPQVDAVVSSAVLAHVAPSEIDAAIASIRRLARRSIVLREKTRFEEASDYQWQHDYDGLLDGWSCVHREVTDVGDTFTAELVAWERPGA